MGILNKIFGQKTEKSATNSYELMQLMLSGGGSDAGITVNSNTAMTYSAVFSAVRVISEAIGMLPVGLYVKDGNSRSPADNHKLNTIISIQPNSWQTSQEFWEMCGACLAGRGNFYAYINRVDGEVRELLPIVPGAATTEQKADYSIVHKVRLIDGSYEEFTDYDIFHVKGFSLDGVTGVNPITYARHAIGIGMAADQQSGKFFRNGSKPDGVLSTEQPLKPEQADEIANTWEDRHGGSSKAFRISVLGSGAKYQPISIDPVDAQMLESRKYQRSEIAAMFRVPLHMLGDLENAHHANMEAAGQEFVTYCLMPYLTRMESRIRVSLLPTKEKLKYFAKWNASALVRGDITARGAFYVQMIQNGVISPNEVRAKEDYAPRDGGDVYLTPLNMAIDGEAPKDTGETNEQETV